jgi:hypothetical protein
MPHSLAAKAGATLTRVAAARMMAVVFMMSSSDRDVSASLSGTQSAPGREVRARATA